MRQRTGEERIDSVAVKVLPADFTADADPSASAGSAGVSARDERRARFEREARTISTLNHPHICALYDVGDHDGVPYLVMEHLAGETLADRLAKGPLPLEQALDLGAQIADALSAAHRHEIVHRDLKPANVMLTKAGAVQQGALQAKLLDFGLAKLPRPEGVRLVADSSAVTQARDVTTAGTLVGTSPYMAPEKIEGREADARTDLWALGCLLYEMVTGAQAFEGATTGSLVGAILAKEPAPLATPQPLSPPALERLVKPMAGWRSSATCLRTGPAAWCGLTTGPSSSPEMAESGRSPIPAASPPGSCRSTALAAMGSTRFRRGCQAATR